MGTVVNVALCVTSLAAALVLAVRPRTDRAATVAHVLMGLGMAGMFSPWGDPTPPVPGAVVFAVVAAWFAARALRGGRADALHLVVGPAAMVLMYLTMSPGTADGGAATGCAGHGAAADAAGPGLIVGAVSLLLAAYFVWHAWHVLRPAEPVPPVGTTAVRVGPRIDQVAHAALSVLMAVMFLPVP